MDTSYWKALSPAAKKSTHPCYLWIASQPTVLLQIHGDKNTSSLMYMCSQALLLLQNRGRQFRKVFLFSMTFYTSYPKDKWSTKDILSGLNVEVFFSKRQVNGDTNQSGVAQWIRTSLWGLCAAPVLIKEILIALLWVQSVENSPPPGGKSSLEKIWPSGRLFSTLFSPFYRYTATMIFWSARTFICTE